MLTITTMKVSLKFLLLLNAEARKRTINYLTIIMAYAIVEQNGLKQTDCGQESETSVLRIRRTTS